VTRPMPLRSLSRRPNSETERKTAKPNEHRQPGGRVQPAQALALLVAALSILLLGYLYRVVGLDAIAAVLFVALSATALFWLNRAYGPRAGTEARINQSEQGRETAAHELRASTELVQGIIDNSPAVIFVKDIGGRYQLVNAEFEKLVGASGEQVLGKTDFDLLPPSTAKELAAGDQEVIEQGAAVNLESVVHMQGKVLTFVTTLFPLRNGDEVRAVAGISTDITERKEAENRLSHIATHDALTGLPNRTLFLDRLRLAIARSKRHTEPVAVLFLDIDRFKAINDRLGHDAGDQMLIALADRLKGIIRPSDTVARFGGDEFAILCEDLKSDDDAVVIAERALEAVAAPLRLGSREMYVTPSIGIATTASADAPEALLRNADMAMYQAKEGGKARFEVFDEGMRDGVLKRLRTEQELRHALSGDELRVLYQPILSVTDRKIVAVEALARWDHPHRGTLLPEEFIAVAEETGLILHLGAQILEEACRQAARWRDRFPQDVAPDVTVNLAAGQLDQPDMVDRVAQVIDLTHAPSESLHLEITETALMEDVAASGAALAKLKTLGVSIDIDDFGTGYSSLGYLQGLPVDTLKIDRSFVGRLGDSPAASGIVAAVVSLAHALRIPAIAEGVETEGQLEELAALGCDLAQGHLFYPALAPEAVDRILLSSP
jgi:diguanylate cyclase (GGDEF)-like protein/PAS domain S-box-containing protein